MLIGKNELRKQLEALALINDNDMLRIIGYPTVVFSLEAWDEFFKVKQRTRDPNADKEFR